MVIHSMLQIFHDALLPNDLFNLRLRFNIEWISVKQRKLTVFRSLGLLSLPRYLVVDLAPSRRIMYRIGKVWILNSDLV